MTERADYLRKEFSLTPWNSMNLQDEYWLGKVIRRAIQWRGGRLSDKSSEMAAEDILAFVERPDWVKLYQEWAEQPQTPTITLTKAMWEGLKRNVVNHGWPTFEAAELVALMK